MAWCIIMKNAQHESTLWKADNALTFVERSDASIEWRRIETWIAIDCDIYFKDSSKQVWSMYSTFIQEDRSTWGNWGETVCEFSCLAYIKSCSLNVHKTCAENMTLLIANCWLDVSSSRLDECSLMNWLNNTAISHTGLKVVNENKFKKWIVHKINNNERIDWIPFCTTAWWRDWR